MNVIPVIGKADAFTTEELISFKHRVNIIQKTTKGNFTDKIFELFNNMNIRKL